MKLEKSKKTDFIKGSPLLKEFVEEAASVGSSADAIEWFANKQLRVSYISFHGEDCKG